MIHVKPETKPAADSFQIKALISGCKLYQLNSEVVVFLNTDNNNMLQKLTEVGHQVYLRPQTAKK